MIRTHPQMDLQPSQTKEDRIQTTENLYGFFSRMMISNRTMERIMRQNSDLTPYTGFRTGIFSRALDQIGLNQRRHHIVY